MNNTITNKPQKTVEEFNKRLDDYANTIYYIGDPKRGNGETKETLIKWLTKALTSYEQSVREDERRKERKRIEIAVELWMNSYEKDKKNFQTKDFINYLFEDDEK